MSRNPLPLSRSIPDPQPGFDIINKICFLCSDPAWDEFLVLNNGNAYVRLRGEGGEMWVRDGGSVSHGVRAESGTENQREGREGMRSG
mmetsp:Transcript_8367/g.13158  ORF Transcript_8367/g.13158 Transcript_8367/m.13158 type:complete len:88 (+) Transcript_8367:166-429(+)